MAMDDSKTKAIASFMERLLDGVEVEWRPMKSVCGVITTGKLNANAMEGDGIYPFFTCNETPYKINTHAFDLEAILISGNGSQVGHLNYYKGKFNAYQRTYVVGDFKENVQVMYLFHYLIHTLKTYITQNSRKGSIPYITMPMLENFQIPIPCPAYPKKSLEIQAGIARILDAFTELTTELTTELNARKKQYNYYRDQLLSFEEGEVEWRTLDQVAHFANGKGHEKDITEDGKYIVVNSKFISTDGEVAKYSNSQICPLFKDDILLVMSDLPNGKALSKTFIVDVNDRYTLNQRIGGITVKNKKEFLPKFMHYFLNRTPQLLKHNNGVDQTNLRKGQILEVKIPVISPAEQERIVAILDKFDTLTRSITEGLPHEIELRQKQYEYYRDLLLSFPKPEASIASTA